MYEARRWHKKRPVRDRPFSKEESKLLGSCRRRWLRKLATGRRRQVNHSAANFNVSEITTALRAHGILAFECRVPKSFKTRLEARRPSANIGKFRRTGQTRRMACSTLGDIHFSA